MPPKTAKPAPRAKRSKADIENAFQDIRQDIESSRESGDAKAEQLALLREQELQSSFQDFSVEQVVSRISDLNLQINRSLTGISEQLTAEVRRLADAREAVEIEKRELERLHKIDIAATALDQLVEEHSRRDRQFESDMDAKQAQWTEQVKAREKEQKEFDEQLKRTRQRELDEYEYKKALERRKAEDKYNEEQRLIERRNLERQDTLEKSWAQREASLKEREQELEQLRKESQTFADRLQKEVKAAVAENEKSANARFQQEKLILQKDAEAEKKVADLRIASLEETVRQQRSHIEALEKRLEEAKSQVQEIAVRAIEGASGSRALAHVNQIAMEQAKQRSQPG